MHDYIVLAIMAFIQNFTNGWSSRTRASAAVLYHWFTAIIGNAVWFISFSVIMRNVWLSVLNGDVLSLVVVLLIYCFSTATGSAVSMWWLLKTEKGNRRVGAGLLRKDGK